MNSTTTAPAPVRRLVLVPVGPPAGRDDASVRRYRLARLRLEGGARSSVPSRPAAPPGARREVAREERFAHCRRSYD
jgi:hypothetical protein